MILLGPASAHWTNHHKPWDKPLGSNSVQSSHAQCFNNCWNYLLYCVKIIQNTFLIVYTCFTCIRPPWYLITVPRVKKISQAILKNDCILKTEQTDSAQFQIPLQSQPMVDDKKLIGLSEIHGWCLDPCKTRATTRSVSAMMSVSRCITLDGVHHHTPTSIYFLYGSHYTVLL